jgi:hypothetical protein
VRDAFADLFNDTSNVGAENEGVTLDEEVVFTNLCERE